MCTYNKACYGKLHGLAVVLQTLWIFFFLKKDNKRLVNAIKGFEGETHTLQCKLWLRCVAQGSVEAKVVCFVLLIRHFGVGTKVV